MQQHHNLVRRHVALFCKANNMQLQHQNGRTANLEALPLNHCNTTTQLQALLLKQSSRTVCTRHLLLFIWFSRPAQTVPQCPPAQRVKQHACLHKLRLTCLLIFLAAHLDVLLLCEGAVLLGACAAASDSRCSANHRTACCAHQG